MMEIFTDFHVHSKYSRATSKDMDLENLDKWAKIKGLNIIGTGDFTHPLWFKELKKKLKPAEPGLFKLKKSETRFILTSEISCIYSENGKVRKVHMLILAPSFKAVEKINYSLGLIGNLKSDGRPILGLNAKELVKIALTASKDCLLVPCHIFTPWFSVLGSKSGFDSLKECFNDYAKDIFAIETGISSDPGMISKISFLDNISLLSNSDAHSPQKIGREANVFDTELSYFSIIKAIKEKKNFLYTIEFFPEGGKYHLDGHRACNIKTTPEHSKKYNNICPVCKKSLTIGVLNRAEELSDKRKPTSMASFKSLVPLEEIIADFFNVQVGSKKARKEYDSMILKLKNEFNILLFSSFEELKKATFPKLAEGIIRAREGKVFLEPGYDGVYGKVGIFSKKEKAELAKKKTIVLSRF